MSAVQITEYGSTDKLTITEATGRSEPGEGQMLVRVTAASINRIDAALTAGYLSHMFPLQLPVTVGGDFSGTVVQAGPGVDTVTAGDRVIGQAGVLLGGSGSFADLGADEVYAYSESDWLNRVAGVAGVDAILDATSGIDAAPYYKLLKPGGRMVSMATQHDAEAAAAAGVEATTQMTQPKADVLTALVRLVDEGVIRQRIAGTFPVAEARAAFAASQKGGKTIVTL